jgi:hypothetical protein
VAKLPKKNVMPLMLFYGKNIGLFGSMLEMQSFLFILSNYDKKWIFFNKGYATNAFLWSKFNKNGFHVRKVFISQFLQKMSINNRIFKQK